jgi:hypothetical protein
MIITIANLPQPVCCNYRSLPVAAPLGQWRHVVHFYPLRGLRDWRHAYATDPSKLIGTPITSCFAGLYRKVQTQIPIALPPTVTALPRSAVSSFEACQTPAR